MLDRQRYHALGTQYEKTAQGVEGAFVIADLLEPKAFWFRSTSASSGRPTRAFKRDRALLCANGGSRGPASEPQPLPVYCFWKPGNPLGCKPRELGNVRRMPPFSLYSELGPDPVEKYLYGAILVYDKDPLKREDDPRKQAKLRSVRLFRFPLADDSLRRTDGTW